MEDRKKRWLNIVSDQLCLYCFENFDSKEMLVRCELEDDDLCPYLEDQAYHDYWLHQKPLRQPRLTPASEGGFLGRLGRMRRKYACSHCNEESYTLCCPHCHNVLPHPEDRENEILLSLLGEKLSGKTVYLGMLCEIFNQVMAPRYALVPHNAEVRDRYQDNYVLPLKDLRLPQTTRPSSADPDVRHPLIFELREAGEDAQAKRLIILHDTAGEQLSDPKALRRFNRYIIHSQGMMLFVDAAQAPKVHQRLVDPPPRSTRSATDILNTVNRMIVNEKNLSGDHLDSHMAVALSKIDVLSDVAQIGNPPVVTAGFEILEPSRHGPHLSMREVQAVSEEIESLLFVIGAQDIVANVGGIFDSHHYFGLSALGHSPDPVTGRLERPPEPHRLLDPFLWILAQLEVIDVVD